MDHVECRRIVFAFSALSCKRKAGNNVTWSEFRHAFRWALLRPSQLSFVFTVATALHLRSMLCFIKFIVTITWKRREKWTGYQYLDLHHWRFVLQYSNLDLEVWLMSMVNATGKSKFLSLVVCERSFTSKIIPQSTPAHIPCSR